MPKPNDQKILKHLAAAKEFVLDVLFPKNCVVCKKDGVFICEDCLYVLASKAGFYCPKCRKRIPPSEDPQCSGHCFAATKIKAVFSLAKYDDPPIKELLHYFKFGGVKEIGKIMAGALFEEINDGEFDLSGFTVIPVPLHRRNLRKRGFNQSEIMAETFATLAGLPLLTGILVKTKNTPHQTETKNRQERLENLVGAFEVKDKESVAGKNILLVDDIVTTGATLAECAKTLKKSGAKKIYGITIAR